MNPYYYYCSEIRNMMKIAKVNDEIQIFKINNEVILVKYCKEFDDFLLSYSWNMKEEAKLPEEVQNVLKVHSVTEEPDVIQIGMVTVYGKNEEELCGLIGDCKNGLAAPPLRDTSYLFCGHKVLRVIQYFGMIRFPLQNLTTLHDWNDVIMQNKLNGFTSMDTISEISYFFTDDNNVVFSFGLENNKTAFIEKIKENVPQLVCIDTFLGIVEEKPKG